jgi:hypothetical protein
MPTYDILMLEICYDWDFPMQIEKSEVPERRSSRIPYSVLRSRNRLNLIPAYIVCKGEQGVKELKELKTQILPGLRPKLFGDTVI